ncbi:MAG: hypothetical protein Q9179_007033 [Wetmoreana sp. 5 TL-2023]
MSQNRSNCTLLDVALVKGDLSNRILRGAFDVKDLQIQKNLDFEHLFRNQGLQIQAKNYTSIAVSILNQLTHDIYVSMDLFAYSDWDPFILQDAVKLLRYTLDDLFGGGDKESGKAKGLGVAYEVCKDSVWKDNFKKARKAANAAFSALLNHLRSGGTLSDDFFRVSPDDKISTATFYELMIRNQAQKIRYMHHDSTKVEIVNQFLGAHNNVGQNISGAKQEYSWHPATFVIVRDRATGLVFTGATKAQAIGIARLEKLAYDITVMRLGKKFREDIDKCNTTFAKIRNDNLTDRPKSAPPWFKDLIAPSAAIQNDLPDVPIFRTSTNTIANPSVFCSAKTTSTTIIKPPCMRCQCFYFHWDLESRPKLQVEKWNQYKDEADTKQFIKADYGFNYCAETVAAAQLFSLHTGNVISDVQDDSPR